MSDQPTNPAAIEPQAPHADGGNTDFETEAEHNVESDVPNQPLDATGMTAGIPAPPSPLLDTEDGGSDWDHENFTPPTLEEMPTEGPGSPGYDVYAPENAKWENQAEADAPVEGTQEDDEANAPLPDEVEDDEDTKSALEADTADGPGDTDPAELPKSDIPDGEKLVDDYEDLEPRGEDLDDTKDNA
jgi:hypothetical protein